MVSMPMVSMSMLMLMLALMLALTLMPSPAAAQFAVVGDAIPTPLTAEPGNAARGRAVIVNRQTGLCLLCHTGPFAEEPFQGSLAPSLAGVGGRLSAGQLRLRLVDGRQLNPATIMPSYLRADGLQRVGTAWWGKPLLSAQQIEDVIAMLLELQP